MRLRRPGQDPPSEALTVPIERVYGRPPFPRTLPGDPVDGTEIHPDYSERLSPDSIDVADLVVFVLGFAAVFLVLFLALVVS